MTFQEIYDKKCKEYDNSEEMLHPKMRMLLQQFYAAGFDAGRKKRRPEFIQKYIIGNHITKVKAFNNHGDLVGIFASVKDAANYYGVGSGAIFRSIQYKRFMKNGVIIEKAK